MSILHELLRIDGLARPPSPQRRARLREMRRAIELGLPIPGTGNTRGGYGHWLREPRHIGMDRFMAASAADTRDGRLRLSGRAHRPPDAYDDLRNRSSDDRNWKRFRRTRWKQDRAHSPPA